MHLVVNQKHASSVADFISDSHIFWEAGPWKTCAPKEQPSADLRQAYLLLALMVAWSPHLITMYIFKGEGIECNLS